MMIPDCGIRLILSFLVLRLCLSPVESAGLLPCSNERRILVTANYFVESDDPPGRFRLKICSPESSFSTLTSLSPLNSVALAESEELCRSSTFVSLPHLRNETQIIDRQNCFLTEPLLYDPFSKSIHLCLPETRLDCREKVSSVLIPPPSLKYIFEKYILFLYL